jgi:hypothetical protein
VTVSHGVFVTNLSLAAALAASQQAASLRPSFWPLQPIPFRKHESLAFRVQCADSPDAFERSCWSNFPKAAFRSFAYLAMHMTFRTRNIDALNR